MMRSVAEESPEKPKDEEGKDEIGGKGYEGASAQGRVMFAVTYP